MGGLGLEIDVNRIVARIMLNPDFKKLDRDTVKAYVVEAIEAVKQYNFPSVAFERAIYLYTCNMLYADFPNHANQYKSVKVENATYTRFGDNAQNMYWEAFVKLLDEYGLRDWKVKFL